MSKIKKKYIVTGLTTDGLSARDLPAGNTAVNYTPTQTASEGNDKISAHLKGIDSALATLGGSGEVIGTSSILQNQITATDLTGLLFNGTSFRSIEGVLSVYRATSTVEKTETVYFQATYNTLAGTWVLSIEGTGNSGCIYNITNSGQMTYTSDTLSGVSYTSLVRYKYRTFAV